MHRHLIHIPEWTEKIVAQEMAKIAVRESIIER